MVLQAKSAPWRSREGWSGASEPPVVEDDQLALFKAYFNQIVDDEAQRRKSGPAAQLPEIYASDLRRCLARAGCLANGFNATCIELWHLVFAIAGDPDGRSALQTRNIDVKRLREAALAALLEPEIAGTAALPDSLDLSAHVERVLTEATKWSQRRINDYRTTSAADVIDALRDEVAGNPRAYAKIRAAFAEPIEVDVPDLMTPRFDQIENSLRDLTAKIPSAEAIGNSTTAAIQTAIDSYGSEFAELIVEGIAARQPPRPPEPTVPEAQVNGHAELYELGQLARQHRPQEDNHEDRSSAQPSDATAAERDDAKPLGAETTKSAPIVHVGIHRRWGGFLIFGLAIATIAGALFTWRSGWFGA
jgi:hypothetical protein